MAPPLCPPNITLSAPSPPALGRQEKMVAMQQGDFRVPAADRVGAGAADASAAPALQTPPRCRRRRTPVDLSPVTDPLTYVRWALLLQEQLVVSHAERERLLQEVARMQHEVASLRQAIAAREQEIAATLREAKGEEAAATFEAKAAAAAPGGEGGVASGAGGPVQRDASFKLNDENIQRRVPHEGGGGREAAEAKRPADAEPPAEQQPPQVGARHPPDAGSGRHRTRHFLYILRPGVMCESAQAARASVPRVARSC